MCVKGVGSPGGALGPGTLRLWPHPGQDGWSHQEHPAGLSGSVLHPEPWLTCTARHRVDGVSATRNVEG